MIESNSIDLIITNYKDDIQKKYLKMLKSGSFIFILSIPRQDVMSKVIVSLQDIGFKTGFTSIYYTSKLGVKAIIVAMKPLSEKSYIDQAIKNGKGISWFDDCRIPVNRNNERSYDKEAYSGKEGIFVEGKTRFLSGDIKTKRNDNWLNQGRFPANLLVSDDVLNDGRISNNYRPNFIGKITGSQNFAGRRGVRNEPNDTGSFSRYFDLDKWWEKRIENFPKSFNNSLKLFSYLIILSSRENDIIFSPVKIDSIKIACKTLNRKVI